jgi:hypothetical protein
VCELFYVYFEKSQIRIENDSAGPNNAILQVTNASMLFLGE